MKRGHFIFESILMSITIILGVSALAGHQDEEGIYFLLWLIPLGVLQVIHSIIIGVTYRAKPIIIRLINIYFLITGLDLLILFFSYFRDSGSDSSWTFTVIIIPLLLASFLWLITFYCLEKKQPIIDFDLEKDKDVQS